MTEDELAIARVKSIQGDQSILIDEEPVSLVTPTSASSQASGLGTVGWLLFAVGLCLMAYALIGYDPSVESSSSDVLGTNRINNTGLLNRQLMIFVGGGAFTISGAVIGSVARLIAAIQSTSGAKR